MKRFSGLSNRILGRTFCRDMFNVNRTTFQILMTVGAVATGASSTVAQTRIAPENLAGPFSRAARGPDAFALPRNGLNTKQLERFFEGQRLFNLAWVAAPSPTIESDGLGPVFNRTGCGRCHERNGRGKPPAGPGEPLTGAALRLGIPDTNTVKPDPVYGRQLQSRSNPGIRPEGFGQVRWRIKRGVYSDGTPYILRAPVLSVRDSQFGALNPRTRISLRVAPPVFGMGPLSLVSERQLAAFADEMDKNGDGISGRLARLSTNGKPAIGRFGWKAAQSTLRHQTASAFSQDMGLTTTVFPHRVCAAGALDCRAAAHGGAPEVSEQVLQTIVFYMRQLAVPSRRKPLRPSVAAGEKLFHETGCAACHRPTVTIITPSGPVRIYPFTDLLLHDMGEGLSDGLPEGAATAREWRTPPLWGLGRALQVNGNRFYLHDGRARFLTGAILWHGGEAAGARETFRRLKKSERDALIDFLKSL